MANGNVSSSLDHLSTVKELILDEQKLVTYVSLSKNLCIHVNEAKVLLTEAVQEIKAKDVKTNLNINFIITGLSGNNSARSTVCPESDLEAQRSLFQKVFFQHIYSVSQGPQCVNTAAFISLNKFEDYPLCAGLIKGNSCTKRSIDEIGTLKSNSQVKVEEQNTVIPPKKENKEKNREMVQNSHKDNENVVHIHKTISEPVIKSEVTSPKKETSSSKTGKISLRNGNKQSKDIAGFFTKSNSAPNSKSTKSVQEVVQPVVKPECELEIKDEVKDVDVECQVKFLKKEPTSTNKIVKKNSSLNLIKKNAKVDKKRKRVLRVSDSESDEATDPFADDEPLKHESDDEIPPTPSTNTVTITSGILNPKKKRKIVDKTYTDEEGYILTRKEEVYESCSDDEVEPVKTEPVQIKGDKENIQQITKAKTETSKDKKGKTSKKKVSPPQKGKQATLTNFFKKV